MPSPARLATGAIGAAGLLIFLNYQYVLVKPHAIRPAEAFATHVLAQGPSPVAAEGLSEGLSEALAEEAAADENNVERISTLEAELTQLREQIVASSAAPVPVPMLALVKAVVTSGYAEKPCPYPCGPDGTCNRAIGECSCPPHRTGKNCAEPMFPACASMFGYKLQNAPCGLPEATFPLTCECAAQCDDANLLMRRMCFEHRAPGDSGRERTKRWLSGSSDERWTMTVLDSPAMLDLINERAEASRQAVQCSGNGIFMAQLPRWLDPHGPVTSIPPEKFNADGPQVCICMPTHWGDKCQHPMRSFATCLNRCNGRGRCVESVCACEEGFWGADCSLRVNPDGGYSLLDPPRPDHGVTAKVYVYELPGRFTTWLAAQSNAHEWTHSWWFYDNDISLHQRFLASPYRTANPEEADFFFIPLYRSLGAYTAGWGPGVITPKGWRAYTAAISFVNRTFPMWHKDEGKTHRWGWGQRVFEAILSGCIPVIMQSDNAQPFAHILPWHRFAVMLNESHIPNLHEILAAIPQSQVEAMQRTLSCVWPRLAFFSSPSQKEAFGKLSNIDSFEMMMLELSAHKAKARGELTRHAWDNATRMLVTDVCSCAMTPADMAAVSVPVLY
ncbi:hypothetical protein T492DRAFT_1151180 [Pavlovales sp. CCMP2436]|nr:hypothetical protein T492DRAFT_1151180 [Pavlovales sp. CCMP2436]